ncbi:MAG: AraC family transcriptional regulator [Victivallaceae bacterium]|jgi:AraC-like DNA-binding protein
MILNELSPYVRNLTINVSRGLTPAYIDPEHVFTYLKSGHGYFIMADMQYAVQPGDLIIIPPYLLHIINCCKGEPLIQYVIHFDLQFDSEKQGKLLLEEGMNYTGYCELHGNFFADFPAVVNVPIPERHRVEEIFRQMSDELKLRPPYWELTLKAGMLELLNIFFRSSKQNSTAPRRAGCKNWHNLERALQYIQAHYREPLDLAAVSREAGLSLNYLCRVFKDYTHTSIHQYINTVRLVEAKRRIATGESSFKVIAAECGFSSVHLFSRIFKAISGQTPSEYRDKIQAAGKH